jgi:hypothetical protein
MRHQQRESLSHAQLHNHKSNPRSSQFINVFQLFQLFQLSRQFATEQLFSQNFNKYAFSGMLSQMLGIKRKVEKGLRK